MSSLKRNSSDGITLPLLDQAEKDAIDSERFQNIVDGTEIQKKVREYFKKCLTLHTRIYTYVNKKKAEKKEKGQDEREALLETREHYRKTNRINVYLNYIKSIGYGLTYIHKTVKKFDWKNERLQANIKKIEVLKKILKNYNSDNGGSSLPGVFKSDVKVLEGELEYAETVDKLMGSDLDVTVFIERDKKLLNELKLLPQAPTYIPNSTKEKNRVAIEVKRKGGSFKLKKRLKKNTRKKKRN
jgi:hypothetical protein